ncbi:MAG TPA: hypothetical protein VEN28_03375 [Burkholderiaceae bacterium]|nr:hypothetical protein [Burkholderiaceae bacterium]
MANRRKKDDRSDIQGEGDYRSARELRAFVRSHDTHKIAEEAAPQDANEAAELERAEREGKTHARPDPETGAPGEKSTTSEQGSSGGVKGTTTAPKR